MTPKPSPEPDPVFAGGMLSTDAHPQDEPAPLGCVPGSLIVTGEGNDDVASIFQDGGHWETTEGEAP